MDSANGAKDVNRSQIEHIIEKYQAKQDPAEMMRFFDIVEVIKPKTVLEIGVDHGGTIRLWDVLIEPPEGLIIGVDIKRPFDTFENARNKVELVIGDSSKVDTVENVRKVLGNRQVDMLFIDGDHSDEGIDSDYRNYAPFVRSGGIIGLHDVVFAPGISKFWRGMIDPTKVLIEGWTKEGVFGIGVVFRP